ncbi:Protein of unknown function [Lactobacillus helveticus CIRM-BIA 951]|uniref:Uncharacterized protein n=2 Tax=Lactobacillus helveticus TaxID=1587 RepID=U6FA38_LACHE|nr:Protein of unknown function [Lactobacillus helveticus CIRM-BIA 951]CDI61073.1 Protein of unknown function [Lactobacillus helveticus CIRM-BIA 104]CDI63316.1 Protein of unknown function [Lactobacillus helveticus CIRM-BIA 103]
MEYFAETKN